MRGSTQYPWQKHLKEHYLGRIEDEYDITVANEAYGEYVRNGKKKPAHFRTMEGIGLMSYGVETTERFDREFKKLDRYTQRMIKAWIEKNLVECENPRLHGKGLTANRSGQWRYRIGDYRLICQINDNKLVIFSFVSGT